MHSWVLRTYQFEKDEDVVGFEDSLNEPIPGITRDERYDEIEGAAFAQIRSLMAG